LPCSSACRGRDCFGGLLACWLRRAVGVLRGNPPFHPRGEAISSRPNAQPPLTGAGRIMINSWGSDLPMRRQLKNRARFYSRAHCVVIKQHLIGKALASDWRAAPPSAGRCALGRGFRRRPSLHSRRRPSSPHDGVGLRFGTRRPPSRRDLRKGPRAKRGRCRLAAPCRRIVGRGSRRRPCRVDASGPAARARKEIAAA
jgi:hypothetical protein